MPKEQLHAVQNAILTEKHCLFLKRKNKFFHYFIGLNTHAVDVNTLINQ